MSDCGNPVTCLNGNCIGCKNKKVWCQDPRCAPNCAGSSCQISDAHDFNGGAIVLAIVFCLLMILFIVWSAYGPLYHQYHNNHKKAGVVVPDHKHVSGSREL